TQDPDDALALEALVALHPSDSATAAALARLYIADDRYKQARRVLGQARFFHPESPLLWELTVKAAATLDEEEAAYQEMVKRFPEEPKYAISLGATRVKRGDHAGARAVLEPLTQKGPGPRRGQAHYQLARSCLLQGKPAEALRQFEAAAKA